MKNKINIRNLECFGFHGVFEEEKALGQKFIVSVELSVDFSKAVESDQCEDTVDYGKISQFLIEEVKKTKFDLIEALADYLAKQILVQFPLVEGVVVEIKKPWAPLLMSLDSVSVTVERHWENVYVGVGSNMGDSRATIEKAIEQIKDSQWIRDVKLSNLIETKPYGYQEQDDFINGVLFFQTLLYPMQLLRFLQKIEKDLDRIREIHWGPRTIDLDILFFGKEISEEPELVLPHPEICKRDFVLKPLCELNPYLIHPVEHKRVSQMYVELISGDSYEKTLK